MRGTLGLFNLFELLQLLNAAGRSGVLLINHPRYGECRIYFKAGRIVHAASRNVFDEGVLYNLLRDERGEFEFQTGRSAPEESITQGFDALMFAVVRMLPSDDAPRNPTEGGDPRETGERSGLTVKLRLQVDRRLSGKRVALSIHTLERWELQLDQKVRKVRLRLDEGREVMLSVSDAPDLDLKVLTISSEALLYHGLSAGQSVLVRPARERSGDKQR